MKKLLTTSMLLLLSSIGILNAQTVYVHAAANGNNTGTSWANAYTDLSVALNNAPSGASIWIAAGVYKFAPGSNRNSTFQIFNKSLNLYGGFPTHGNPTQLGQRNPLSFETIVSGDIEGNDPAFSNTTNMSTSGREDNAYHVFTITQNASSYSVLIDGLVIEGGNANGANDQSKIGAAVYYYRNTNGSPTQNATHTVRLKDCKIRNNTADKGAAIASHYIFANCRTVNIQLHNSQLYNNNAEDFPLHYMLGPQNVILSYTLEMIGNVIFNNASFNSLGSGLIHASSNETISGNYSSYSYSFHFNTFANNFSTNGLGAICVEGAVQNTFQSRIEAGNNIVYGNSSPKFLYRRAGKPKVIIAYLDYNVLSETDSMTTEFDGGNTLIGIDPNLANMGSFNYLDYGLSNCSQAINSGSLNLYAKDNSSYIMLSLPYTTDIAGNSRTTHGVIDRGALEFQGANYPVTTNLNQTICYGQVLDFNGDELTTSGLYTKTFPRTGNCDSVVHLNLTVSEDFIINIGISEVGGVNYVGVAAEGSQQGGFSAYQWYKNDTLLDGETNFFTLVTGIGYYHCVVTKNQSGSLCTKKSPILNLGMPALHVNLVQVEKIQVYPNPTNSQVSWNQQHKGQVTLFDNLGRVIAQTNNNYFDLSRYPTGVYFLKFEHHVGVIKVIKE